MPNCRPLLALLALSLIGCGTASTSENHWAYVGSEATFREPPAMTPSRVHAIQDELRGQPPEVVQRRLRQDFETWQAQVLAAVHDARDACTRETGDSGKRHFWTGYDDAFLACMRARGWSRPLGSDPL